MTTWAKLQLLLVLFPDRPGACSLRCRYGRHQRQRKIEDNPVRFHSYGSQRTSCAACKTLCTSDKPNRCRRKWQQRQRRRRNPAPSAICLVLTYKRGETIKSEKLSPPSLLSAFFAGSLPGLSGIVDYISPSYDIHLYAHTLDIAYPYRLLGSCNMAPI